MIKHFLKRILSPVFFRVHDRIRGQKMEINFWNKWIQNQGDIYLEDFKNRINPQTKLSWPHSVLINYLNEDNVSILDVGSGPITNLGYISDTKNVQIYACDPNADTYNKMLTQYNISPPVKSFQANGENLSSSIHDKFDYISCTNALDHSEDPVLCIFEMIKLLKKNGIIMLIHEINEGINEGYRGYHKWNISFNSHNSFIIWNPLNKQIVSHELLKFECAVWTNNKKIYCIITENNNALDFANKEYQNGKF